MLMNSRDRATGSYEHGDSEDHTEVWTNEEAGMGVRIEWMKIEKM